MIKQLIIFLLFVLLISCNSDNNQLYILIKSESDNNLVQAYIMDNRFIDVDIMDVSYKLMDSDTKSDNLDEDELAQAKAAIYRFYTHVKVENGYYVCTIKDAKEINVSQKTFVGLLEGINILNEGIDKARQDGLPVELREPSEEYLNSLLQYPNI